MVRALKLKIAAALLISSLVGASGSAQTAGGGPSVAALQPILQPLYAGTGSEERAPSQAQTSDQFVLTGAQQISPEPHVQKRNYWQPLFSLSSTADSNPFGLGNRITVVPWASFLGGIDLHASSHRSDLTVNYLGGGAVSQYQNEDGPIQQLTLAERLSGRRAAISFFDQFGFFPQAVSPLSLPTGVLDLSNDSNISLQPAFLPNQLITGTVGQELTNSSVGEFDVSVGAHSSLSVLASYSLVRFFNSNLLDLNDTIGQAGFNQQLTRNNTIGLLYRFTAFRFSNIYQPMNGNIVQVAFGRRITNRWAFDLMAGPELAQYGGTGQSMLPSSNTAVSQVRRIYSTADFSATYRSSRSFLRFGYDRGVTDGAGFLMGAITDAGYGSIEHRLSRRLIVQFTGGYARNRGLLAMGQQQPLNEIYDNWFGSATVSHGWGRWGSIFLTYQLQRQATNFACVGVLCGNDFTRHLFSIGLTRRAQPRLIGS